MFLFSLNFLCLLTGLGSKVVIDGKLRNDSIAKWLGDLRSMVKDMEWHAWELIYVVTDGCLGTGSGMSIFPSSYAVM